MFAVFDTVRSRGVGDAVLESQVLKLICGGDQLVKSLASVSTTTGLLTLLALLGAD